MATLEHHVLGEAVPRRIVTGYTPDERYERVISTHDVAMLGHDGWQLLCEQYDECSFDAEMQTYRLTR